jgi:hypothetical protein
LTTLLASLALTACARAAPPIAAPLPAAESTPPTEPSPPGEATPLPSALLEPTRPPEAAPTEARLVGPGGQFATDPATVELAAGRPTLVKFFAFW